jgi:hypothetical protein
MKWDGWQQLANLNAEEFTCGYCGKEIGTNHGYYYNSSNPYIKIYICTNCGSPTFFDEHNIQHPGAFLGRNIEKLPNDISEIYQEIRESIKCSSYTAAILLGRKLIMHLAVNVANAKEGKTFVEYIDDLKSAGYVPPNGEFWINNIKKLGNEKNHEIKIGTSDEATKILKFIEILLIFVYEFSQEKEEIVAG